MTKFKNKGLNSLNQLNKHQMQKKFKKVVEYPPMDLPFSDFEDDEEFIKTHKIHVVFLYPFAMLMVGLSLTLLYPLYFIYAIYCFTKRKVYWREIKEDLWNPEIG